MKYYFTFHSDPGHAWLEVGQDLIDELGIADNISIASYRKGRLVYLEEDLDAGLFISKMKERQKEFTMGEKHIDKPHWIRQLENYRP